MTRTIQLLHIDCMEYMRTLPDKAFDLAIVDPPYGLGDRFSSGGGFGFGRGQQKYMYQAKRWDTAPPSAEYWAELMRVSRNQIAWGGNYFGLPATRCVVAWVKPAMKNHPNFSQWEMAWTSFDSPAQVVYQNPSNFEGKNIHPTQKPVALYKWLLTKYAKPGDRILDTHFGSGSSAIACHDLGFDYVGCELDADYHAAASERLRIHQTQQTLFTP